MAAKYRSFRPKQSIDRGINTQETVELASLKAVGQFLRPVLIRLLGSLVLESKILN